MAQYNVAPLEKLVEQFERMPGIGHKSAQRLAYYVLNLSQSQARELADAVIEAHTKIRYCARCCNLTDRELCPVCANPARDHELICVVETPRDAAAVENTREYKGVYHVLHGSISPLRSSSFFRVSEAPRRERSSWRRIPRSRATRPRCISQSS